MIYVRQDASISYERLFVKSIFVNNHEKRKIVMTILECASVLLLFAVL